MGSSVQVHAIEKLMNLADEKIDMRVNVDLPWSQRHSEELLAKSFPNFRQPESTAIVESVVRGNWGLLGANEESNLNGGDDMIFLDVELVGSDFPLLPGLDGGDMEVGICVAAENGFLEAPVD